MSRGANEGRTSRAAQPGRLGRPEQRPVDINSTSDANMSPTGAEPTARLPGGLRLQPALPLAYHARRLGPTVHPRPTIGTLLGAAVWPIGNPMATTAPPTPNAVSKHMLESHRATPITRQLTSTGQSLQKQHGITHQAITYKTSRSSETTSILRKLQTWRSRSHPVVGPDIFARVRTRLPAMG